MLMAILLFLALALFVYEKRIWFKAGFAGLAAGFLYAFLRCQSRGASLGLAAGLFIFWLMQRRKLLVATILVATGILGILVLAPTSYLDRLQTITNYQEDKSAMGRLEMWQISLGLIARNPVVGIGPANFAPRFPHMSQHNAYLQVASEVGIPALLLYVALLVSGYRALWVARKLASPARRQMPYLYKISEGILCALIAITVQGFVTGFAFREFVYITLTLAYCVRELAESGPSPEDLTPSQAAAPADYAPA
jgi:O-antigen ligase